MSRHRSRKNRAKKSKRMGLDRPQVRKVVEAEIGPVDPDAASKQGVPSSHAEDRTADLAMRLSFASDIIDKQYRSYIWNDGKVQALVRIDAALIAGLLVVLQVFALSVNQLVFGVLAGSFVCFVLEPAWCVSSMLYRESIAE